MSVPSDESSLHSNDSMLLAGHSQGDQKNKISLKIRGRQPTQTQEMFSSRSNSYTPNSRSYQQKDKKRNDSEQSVNMTPQKSLKTECDLLKDCLQNLKQKCNAKKGN